MIAAQSRGRDAAGVAFLSGETIHTLKSPGTAEDLVKAVDEGKWAEIAASPRGMLHARAKTKGEAKNNANNHPVAGFEWVVVHNGHVNNDDDVYAYYKAERFAEVDTSAIPLVLSQGGDDYLASLGHVATLGGNITTSVWSPKWIDRIALIRLGTNDLYLIQDRERDILYWTSTLLGTQYIPAFKLGSRFNMYTVGQLNDDRVLLLNPEGRDATRLMEIKRQAFSMPRVWTAGGNTTTPNPTRAQPTASTAGATDAAALKAGLKKNRTFKWGRPPLATVFNSKPWPARDSVPDSFEAYWNTTVMSRFNNNGALLETTVPTGYGNWYWMRMPDTKQIVKEFRPHKRVKEWFRRTFRGDELETLLNLPAESTRKISEAYGTVFDRRLPMESFFFQDWEGEAHTSHPGYMCPWCGCLGLQTTWAGANFRCWLCRIESRPEGG